MVQPEYFCSSTFWSFPISADGPQQYNAQKPKVSVRWEPLDPKWIGALILRGSYTEAFHAPHLSEISPASSQNFTSFFDPFLREEGNAEERIIGNSTSTRRSPMNGLTSCLQSEMVQGADAQRRLVAY
jgi:hypothetical protein